MLIVSVYVPVSPDNLDNMISQLAIAKLDKNNQSSKQIKQKTINYFTKNNKVRLPRATPYYIYNQQRL